MVGDWALTDILYRPRCNYSRYMTLQPFKKEYGTMILVFVESFAGTSHREGRLSGCFWLPGRGLWSCRMCAATGERSVNLQQRG